MRSLVVYDSQYGNTEKVAKAIADALLDEVRVLHVSKVNPSQLQTDLLIVGSPTQGGRPTEAIKDFLRDIPANALKDVSVTAFDTRISAKDRGIAVRILLGVIGYAAPRVAGSLKAKGGALASPPEGFVVKAKEGPLKEGELERAAAWAKAILQRQGARA